MARKDNSPNTQSYSKSNYLDVLKIITPDLYFEEDRDLSGFTIGPLEQVINSNLNLANSIGTIFTDLSATTNFQTPNINTLSGIAPYFIKQNELTKITPFDFESKILHPLGKKLGSFESSGDFIEYVSGTLLPSIRLNDSYLHINTASSFGSLDGAGDLHASAVHEYLLNNLSWFYILNTSGDGGLSVDGSTVVLSALGTKIFNNQTLDLVDGMKACTEYVWKNYGTCSVFSSLQLIPEDYVSSTGDLSLSPSATYLSGTQKLDRLNTLLDVIYSPLQFDAKDTSVKTAFENFISLGTKITDLEEAGPFTRFLKALGFFIADVQDKSEQINLIYDVDKTPDFLLPFVAELIGWKFFGHDPERWRMQLKNAVDIYKSMGTKKAIQFAVNSIVGENTFDVSSQIVELWESYIPHLIYYSLATEAKAFKDLNTWTPELAKAVGIPEYSTSSLDENMKIAVDHIMLDLVKLFPNNFPLGKGVFPHPVEASYVRKTTGEKYEGQIHMHDDGTLWTGPQHDEFSVEYEVIDLADSDFRFFYRNRIFPIPPFEKYKYYKDALITEELIDRLVFKLKCFSVRTAFADQVGDYIRTHTVRSNDTFTYTNGWLFFTSSLQVPDNFTLIMDNLLNTQLDSKANREKYLSLWNGKSSHISLIFNVDSFDFTNTRDLNASGALGLFQASRVVKTFLPAHVVGDIAVVASATDSYSISSVPSPILRFDSADNLGSYGSALDLSGKNKGAALGRVGISGIDVVSILGSKYFTRKEVEAFTKCEDSPIRMKFFKDTGTNAINSFNAGKRLTFIDDEKRTPATIFSGIDAVGVPRNVWRRRSFKHVLPKEGSYSRTGFNMPVSWDPSSIEYSLDDFITTSGLGFLPLGYIPSAGSYNVVEDHNNLNAVWHKKEGLNSSSVLSGVPTSATFPCRGLRNIDSNIKYGHESWTGASSDYYVDRGQISPFIGTLWKIQERVNYYQASANIADLSGQATFQDWSSSSFNPAEDWGYWTTSAPWYDAITSYANSSVLNNGWSPNSPNDYENFKFGRGVHKLYNDYIKEFKGHPLYANMSIPLGGADILSHTFGPIFYNGRLSIKGPFFASGVTTTPSATTYIDFKGGVSQGILSEGQDSAYGTYTASELAELPIPADNNPYFSSLQKVEFRNGEIVSGVQLVVTSSLSGVPLPGNPNQSLNHFVVLKLDKAHEDKYSDNYLIDNTVIKSKAIDGFPRIRFDLWGYGHRADPTNANHVRDIVNNHLIPDHTYKLNVKALLANERVTRLGGAGLGVWIHTGIQNNKTWSWTKNGKWEMSDVRTLTSDNIMRNLSHNWTLPASGYEEILDPDTSSIIETCVDGILETEFNSASSFPEGILRLNSEKYFKNFEIIFDTKNQKIKVPQDYFSYRDQANMLGSSGTSALELSSLNLQNWLDPAAGIADTSVVSDGVIGIPSTELGASCILSAVSSIYAVMDNDSGAHVKVEMTYETPSSIGLESGETYTFSVYIAPSSVATSSAIRFYGGENSGNDYRFDGIIDWATSSITAKIRGTKVEIPNIDYVRLEKVDDYWHRLSVTARNHKVLDSDEDNSLRVFPATGTTADIGGCYIFGPKVEKGGLYSTIVVPTPIVVPLRTQVHYRTQKYYVEVFMLPSKSNLDKFMLLDEVTMVDLTENARARIPIMGGESKYEPYRSKRDISCSGELAVPLDPEELRIILNYFNSLQQGSQSRNSNISIATHGTSGGSRLSYREHPEWGPFTKDATRDYYTSLDIIN